VSRIRIGVMVSGHGRGSNMQALIDACNESRIDGQVAVVIGTKSGAPAMERAKEQGIPVVEASPKTFADDEAYANRLLEILAEYEVDLLCLAGYMRILPLKLVSEYRWRIMNIHPGLIPLFCGKGMYGGHVHQAAVDYGVKVSGCTVHFVDEEYDNGPIIIQRVVPVEEGDTADDLAARVLVQEHIAYPEAVQLFAQGRLKVEGRIVHVLP